MAENNSDDDPKDPGPQYENLHVHEVYEQIAPHFSSTRYKPWPLISNFLNSLPAGSVGLDIGAGNGKYLGVNPSLYIIGSDRSQALTQIAASPIRAHKDALVADILSLPHQNGRFDFAMSIAVVHHLSTRERRIEAIRLLLDLVRRPIGGAAVGGGVVLVYVWALEQKNSRRGWDAGQEQDVMVPWIMKGQQGKEDQTFHRYYHLYREGELNDDIRAAGGSIVDSGYEKDNWWATASPTH